jgi:signal transduction histidine kinase
VPTTLHFIHLTESLRETCLQAARAAFPHATVRTASSVAEALREKPDERELLVLAGPDEAEGGLASQALDAGELPRWAVVHLGSAPSDLFETVPPEDWNPRQLARIFRSALMQHDLLRENLRLRGDLKTVARRITHDLRTPIGCILTVCEALKDPARAGMPPDEVVGAVRDSALELSQLTDRVSLLLKATLEPVPPLTLSMGPLVAQVIAELPAEFERRAQRIRQPAEWPDAIGVPAWLAFIWDQLIQNALRHGQRTGNVQLGWTREGRDIRFWVSSPGTVPAAMRARLLRPFHLLHQHAGVGLGLALVERLVSLQGGRCGHESPDETRSVFSFTLPAADRPAAEKIARSARNLATS